MNRFRKELYYAIVLLFALLFLLTGCAKEAPSEVPPPTSDLSPEDCYLCGEHWDLGEAAWGQDNLALVSLNTFALMPIEVNCYNDDGLLEPHRGGTAIRAFRAPEEGFSAFVSEYSDRSFAELSVTLYGDAVLDTERLATFLCQDCLTAVCGRETSTGVGLLNLATREIRALPAEERSLFFGDYYIDYAPEESERGPKLDIFVFYCPPR